MPTKSRPTVDPSTPHTHAHTHTLYTRTVLPAGEALAQASSELLLLSARSAATSATQLQRAAPCPENPRRSLQGLSRASTRDREAGYQHCAPSMESRPSQKALLSQTEQDLIRGRAACTIKAISENRYASMPGVTPGGAGGHGRGQGGKTPGTPLPGSIPASKNREELTGPALPPRCSYPGVSPGDLCGRLHGDK